MSIVPVKGKWKVHVRKIDGATRTIEIDQDATVRKLYSAVRHDLKLNWNFREAIQLLNGQNALAKNDIKMNAAGLYNGITLNVVAQSGPYSWDLFVKLPGQSSASTVTIYESQTCEELYQSVMRLQGSTRPLNIKDPIGDGIPNGKTTLVDVLYDGALLTSEYLSKWSLMVLHQSGKSQSLTVEVSPNCFVREVFQEVRKKVSAGEELRLITGTKELNNYMDRRITDSEVGLSHGSCIVVVMRQRGGSDPRVQLLQSCPTKDVVGVSTPTLRACPFCGALVQHTDACKHMNCPACSREFCFICLRKREGGWQCGSYNTKCTAAPRQTYLPG